MLSVRCECTVRALPRLRGRGHPVTALHFLCSLHDVHAVRAGDRRHRPAEAGRARPPLGRWRLARSTPRDPSYVLREYVERTGQGRVTVAPFEVEALDAARRGASGPHRPSGVASQWRGTGAGERFGDAVREGVAVTESVRGARYAVSSLLQPPDATVGQPPG